MTSDAHSNPPANAAFAEALARLTRRVEQLHAAERQGLWDVTEHRKDIERIAAAIDTMLVDLEDFGPAPDAIEAEYDATRGDGSYKATLFDLRRLAQAAQAAANRLPNSRARHALSFAALGFVYLSYHHGAGRPILSNTSPDVVQFDQLCQRAGIYLSRERLRTALRTALDNFDRHVVPEGLDGIL